LEKLFAKPQSAATNLKEEKDGKVSAVMTPESIIKKEIVKLIDQDRSRNIEIILTKLRTPVP
jgi:hypothetical protein